MRVSVRKWGNSLALRIPRSVAADSRIKHGSLVEVAVVKGKLVVAPVTATKYTLDQLLSGVTKKNRHGEIDAGVRAGRESW